MANTTTQTVDTVVIGPGHCATCGGQIGEVWSWGDYMIVEGEYYDDYQAERDMRKAEGLAELDVEEAVRNTTYRVMRHCGVGGHNVYPFPVTLGEIEDAFRRRGYTAYIR